MPVPTDRLATRARLRTAVVWEGLRAVLPAGSRVLDAGGGTGGIAVPLAEAGHHVTVVDPSPDSLAALARRAAEAGVAERVRGVQGDATTLGDAASAGGGAGAGAGGGAGGSAGGGAYDAVLLHSVLEFVDDPAAALRTAVGELRAGGVASVVAATRTGAAYARALAGHLDEAARALSGPDGRYSAGDPVTRRFAVQELRDLLAAAGLSVGAVHGVRVFSDLVAAGPGAGLLDGDPGAVDALLALERTVSDRPEFLAVATQVHALAHRA